MPSRKSWRMKNTPKLVGRPLEKKGQNSKLQYGKVVSLFGNRRVKVQCQDGINRNGHIRGNMNKKIWVGQGDFVLCSIRDQHQKCDIIMKYFPHQVQQLKKQGQIKRWLDNIQFEDTQNYDYEQEQVNIMRSQESQESQD